MVWKLENGDRRIGTRSLRERGNKTKQVIRNSETAPRCQLNQSKSAKSSARILEPFLEQKSGNEIQWEWCEKIDPQMIQLAYSNSALSSGGENNQIASANEEQNKVVEFSQGRVTLWCGQ